MKYIPLKERPRQKVILETDFCMDVDDAGAIAILLDGAKQYGYEICGVSLNQYHPAICDALFTVLASRNREDIPIVLPDSEETEPSGYLEYLAQNTPKDRKPILLHQDDFYNQVLSDAEDNSVTIISIGFLQNMAKAIRNMPELFHQKVSDIIVMGGKFPADLNYREFNVFHRFPEEATCFSEAFSGKVIYSGFEVGEKVFTDFRDIKECPDPVVQAYGKSFAYYRPSWDPLTVDFAIQGENEIYVLSENGRTVFTDGVTHFTPAADGNTAYIRLRKSNEETGNYLNQKFRKCLLLK